MNICIYGASSNEIDASFITATEELGSTLAKRGHALVYGGGAQGLMGAVARGFSSSGGKVIGVAPSFFNVDGVLFDKCDEFIYTDTMRERKQIMEDNADAFIVTPGGIGTFDEFFEIYTLRQLGRHTKPIVIFNINGYFDELISMLKKSVELKFMKPANLKLICVFDDSKQLADYLENASNDQIDISEFKNV